MNAAITYHSVGISDNKYLSKLPTVKVDTFRDQLKILSNKFNLVSAEEFVTSNSGNNILLTFDDGLRCHYDVVAPILDDMNMLLVHQLQVLISESKNNKAIFNSLLEFSVNHCGSMDQLIQKDKNLHIHQYESSDYNFIKKSFQIFINKNITTNYLKDLLSLYCPNKKSFFESMYINLDESKDLLDLGFDIGGHSRSHSWMQYLDKSAIISEIEHDELFFDKLSIPKKYYCYPYGLYSDSCIQVIKNAGFEFAFTIEPGGFEPTKFNPFKIHRYDVNEFFNEVL